MRVEQQFGQRGDLPRFEAQIPQAPEVHPLGQQATDQALAVNRRTAPHTNVALTVPHLNRQMSILGQPPFRDVHPCQNLDAGNDRGRRRRSHPQHVVQHPVDTQPDAEPFVDRVQMNIRGVGVERPLEQQVHQRHGTHQIQHVREFLLKGLALRFGTGRNLRDGLRRHARWFPTPGLGQSERQARHGPRPSDEMNSLQSQVTHDVAATVFAFTVARHKGRLGVAATRLDPASPHHSATLSGSQRENSKSLFENPVGLIR